MITEFCDGLQQFHFLQNALPSGLSLSFIILRGMSLMETPSHYAVLPGVALSFILGIKFLYWRYCLWPPVSVLSPISRATPSSGATLQLGLPFLFPRLVRSHPNWSR